MSKERKIHFLILYRTSCGMHMLDARTTKDWDEVTCRKCNRSSDHQSYIANPKQWKRIFS